MKKQSPSMDKWIEEAKKHKDAPKVGMYLAHNGVVRITPKAVVREGAEDKYPIKGIDFSYDEEKVNKIIEEGYKLNGIYYIKVWLNKGYLEVGEDIMYVLIGGDIRPNVIDGLQYIVGRIKTECVVEREIL